MRGRTIESGKTALVIKLIDIDKTRYHEETIPNLVESISTNIVNSGIQKHPIIVDKNSLMILDGMHRTKSLKKIGCKRIVACLVDYKNPEIQVHRWFRTIGDIEFDRTIQLILSKMDLKFSKVSVDRAIELLERGMSTCAIISKNRCTIIEKDEKNCNYTFSTIKKIDDKLKKVFRNISYDTEEESLKKLEAKVITGIFALPRIKKEDLIKSSLKGLLLPCKATRHIIPARPVDIDAPLRLLIDQTKTLEEANNEFLKFLEQKSIKTIPSGSIFEGRRYDEKLITFKDHM